MSWVIYFFLISAIYGVIISLFLLLSIRHPKRFFLGVYLLMFSITILHYVRFWAEGPINHLHPFLIWVCVGSSWLMPGSLYLFFRHPRALHYKDAIHLLPFFIFSTLWVVPRFEITLPWMDENTISLGKIFLYGGYGIAMLRMNRKNNIDRLLLLGYIGFLFGLIFYRLSILYNFYTIEADYLVCSVFVLLTYGIAYYSQRSFLKEKLQAKYLTSSLTEEEGKYLVSRIHKAMIEHKYYQDPILNLTKLAAYLKVPKYRVSQALNLYSDTSFTELINYYRVKEAKAKLSSGNSIHLKLESIGEEVGFNNKVSFYKNFKKILGVTPGEYRAQQMKSSV